MREHRVQCGRAYYNVSDTSVVSVILYGFESGGAASRRQKDTTKRGQQAQVAGRDDGVASKRRHRSQTPENQQGQTRRRGGQQAAAGKPDASKHDTRKKGHRRPRTLAMDVPQCASVPFLGRGCAAESRISLQSVSRGCQTCLFSGLAVKLPMRRASSCDSSSRRQKESQTIAENRGAFVCTVWKAMGVKNNRWRRTGSVTRHEECTPCCRADHLWPQ